MARVGVTYNFESTMESNLFQRSRTVDTSMTFILSVSSSIFVDSNGTKDTLVLVGGNDALEEIDGPGVLCKDLSGKLESAQEDLAAWLQSIASGYMEGHRVG